jgi:putative transposase
MGREVEAATGWFGSGLYVGGRNRCQGGARKGQSRFIGGDQRVKQRKKVILSIEPGYEESSDGWSAVLRDLKSRGMNQPRLVVGDGHLGIWGAQSNVYPGVLEQRCWNHKVMNVLDKLPKKSQGQGKLGLQKIFSAECRQDAETNRNRFIDWC